MTIKARATDAEGKLADIRLKLTDVPDCCAGCWWQVEAIDQDFPFGEMEPRIVCCGCGQPLTLEEDEE